MNEYQPLNSINLQGGIDTSSPRFSPASQSALSDGSYNAIVAGAGFSRPFSGLTSQGANTGSRKMMPVGKTWGGIKDIGGTQGSGSFFEDIGRSRWGIGAGQPHIEGTDVSGFVLSTVLQVSVASGGVYASPVQAGLAQPSAPEIGIVSTTGDVSNSVSCKIERRRPSTGARSLASPTSAVINPQANRVRVTFPTASTGQTHWRVYFTFQGFGGTGIHYLCKYGSDSDIPESTVSAGTVDGIARSLEFNFKDGDLLPLEASYDDYTPPAATHAIRLENVLNLAGCYVDSSSSPTSTNTGTSIAVSKVNNYESYIPTHLLYLPEQVTDTLARPLDDYGYVACENSVHAIQYVGFRGDELPPCTITTILPDIGVQYPHNWCHFRGRLLIYTAEGNLLLMDESGDFDTEFAAPVTKTIKSWATASTAVGYDPKNDCIFVGNTKTIFLYSLQARVWRQIWLPDFVTGTVTSVTTAKRRLYVTVTNGGSLTAYTFDTGTATAPVSFVSNWQNEPHGNSMLKNIYELAVSAETGATTTKLAVCLGRNMQQTVFRRIAVTSGNNQIVDSDSLFRSTMTGSRVIIFGTNINGAGTLYIEGKISGFTDKTTVTLTKLDGTTFSPSASLTDCLMFIGEFTEVKDFSEQTTHLPNFFPNVPECRSYQLAIWMQGKDSGNVFTADVWGKSAHIAESGMTNEQKLQSDLRELQLKMSYIDETVATQQGTIKGLSQTVYGLAQTQANTPPAPVANLLYNGELGHSVNSWNDTSYVTTDKAKECAHWFSHDGTLSGLALDATTAATSSTNKTLKASSHSTYDANYARWNSSNGWGELTGTKTIDALLPSNCIDATTPLARVSLIAAKKNQYIEIPSDCLMFAGIYDNTAGQQKFLTGSLGFTAQVNGSPASTVERRYKLLITTDRGFSILSPEVTLLTAPTDASFTVTNNVSMSWRSVAGYLEAKIYEYVPSLSRYRLIYTTSTASSFIQSASYLASAVGYPSATSTERQAVYYTQTNELAQLATNGVSSSWTTINFPIGVPNNYDKTATTDRQWLRIGLTVAPNLYVTGCTTDGTTTITAPASVFDSEYDALFDAGTLVAQVYDSSDVLLATTTVVSRTDDTHIVLGTTVATGANRKIRIVGGGFHGVYIDKIHLGYQQNTSYAPNAFDIRTLQPVAAPSSSTQGTVGTGGSSGGIGTCVTGETLIKQADKSRQRVDACKVGDVWDSGGVFPNVLGFLRTGISGVRKVVTENGIEIRCTNTERFVTNEYDTDGTPLYALREGDEVLTEIDGRIEKTVIISIGRLEPPELVYTPTLTHNKLFIAGLNSGGGFVLHNAKPITVLE